MSSSDATKVFESLVKKDIAFLRKIYVKNRLTFPTLYGRKALDYMCMVSAVYARKTMPAALVESDPACVRTMVLWMMIGWPIDNVFDKCRSATTKGDVRKLMGLLDLSSSSYVGGEKGEDVSHPLLESLIESTETLYKVYLKRVKPYVAKAPEAWELHKQWFGQYVETVRENPKLSTVKEFAAFRLPGGGIMCQFAQTMLFMGKKPVPSDMPLWTKTALTVAYFNDLVSVARDVEQETPNLVTVRAVETGESLQSAICWADSTIAEMETELELECMAQQSEPYVSDVVLTAIKNSREWHLAEPRYARDTAMVEAARSGNQEVFDAMCQQLNSKYSTLGDPSVTVH